ncbi:hypothetical protein FCN77_16255 [Arthrobacter sp. 24S4-2]|uniref:hypothetical protein n=1 Tax=Arthrobacter sp. 24S4-2 TaxID=2575374 RepID=UPI0010C78FDC|nr:hypothetical protein [Arthrobacter sp. 24S4-2]QCO98967.1 hypothetical protein FCN77_16255 [Arthrobacter sp. 24S4-2]
MYWNYANEEFIQSIWPEAADIDSVLLDQLLSTANSLCVSYAPVLPEGASIPGNYRMAEVITARDIWSKMSGGNREEFGPDGLAIPVAPLIYLARDLLRPKTSPLGRLR